MQFMLQYPDVHGTDQDMLESGEVGDVAVALEKADWDGLAFTEHPAPGINWLERGGHQSLDPFIALAGAATVTKRLRLLSYLAVVPYRNPLLLAKTTASLDRISKGRFILGAGTGYLKGEFRALGVDFDERNVLFDEALDVLPLHWSGEPFSYRGRHFEAKNTIGRPRPTNDTIPIWIGGNSKITLRRVAERAHGWMPLLGPDEMFATTRTPHPGSASGIAATIGSLVPSLDQRGIALDVAIPYMDATIARPREESDRHRAEFEALEEIGCTWTVINVPPVPPSQMIEFIESFSEVYIQA